MQSCRSPRRIPRTFTALTAAASLFVVAPRAFAGDPVAERLYLDGRAAAQSKDWNRACELFQQSQHREPAPGTLINLAHCEEQRGKLVTAIAQYSAAARLFQPGNERGSYAKQQAAALEKRVAKLRVRVEGDATIECDGLLVDNASFGSAVPMDPGEHVFVVRAKGHADARSTILLSEGESRTIELTLGPLLPAAASDDTSATATEAATTAGSPATSGTSPASVTTTEAIDTTATGNRTPAYVAFGIGAIGIGVGAVTGFLALDSASTASARCPSTTCVSQADAVAAEDSASRARTWAATSTIGLGVGLAATAVGTYLLLRKPSRTAVAPAVGTGSAGLVVRGTF